MKNDEFLKKSSEPNVNPNVIQFLSVRNTTFAYLPYTLMECMVNISKGLFTRYDFVACDKLTTGLRHELFRVNQTYNSLTTLKSCRRPVVSLSHATKSCRVNRT